VKQSNLMSWVETILNTSIGFVIAMATQVIVFPLFGYAPPLSTNFKIAGIFTVVSIVRGYCLRRLFELIRIRRLLSPFMQAAIAERFRQVEGEGWAPDHDDNHSHGELAAAGATYALHAGTQSPNMPHEWPWSSDWWKPQGFRRDLVRAAALILAEGDRFDRSRKSGRGR
jgi:hypothetical protein